MKNLQNKTALVTGGSRGIGAAIAKRLAREGAKVAITWQSSCDKAAEVINEIKQLGGEAIAIQADSADARAVISAVDETARHFGGLNILVNNAGIARYDDFAHFTLEDFDRITAVNIRAVFAASQQVLRYMGKGGRIISIASCQAERMPGPGGSLYAMSKAALVGLTKGMARDLGPKGITVNAVHPGPINTDMNPATGPSADFQRSLLALSEFGIPEDIAGLVAYLAGPESGFVTGAGFVIDGGTNI